MFNLKHGEITYRRTLIVYVANLLHFLNTKTFKSTLWQRSCGRAKPRQYIYETDVEDVSERRKTEDGSKFTEDQRAYSPQESTFWPEVSLSFKGGSDSKQVLLLNCTLSLVPQGIDWCTVLAGQWSCYLKRVQSLKSLHELGLRNLEFLSSHP